MSIRLFDTHAHLYDSRFEGDEQGVFDRMREVGVQKCVVVGSDAATSLNSLALAASRDGLYCAMGIHPHEAKDATQEDYRTIENNLFHPKAVAWGEIGLDYHYDFSPRGKQTEVFSVQLDIAARLNVPVILHIREAHEDALRILRAQKNLPRCVAHCFSGDWETAKEYLDLGAYISFAGTVTFKNAGELISVARKIPLERMLIETDSPYLAPVPVRGRRNEPANVAYIAEHIAALRNMGIIPLTDTCWHNALAFFDINE